MNRIDVAGPYTSTRSLPRHLAEWRLPPGWRWGTQGVFAEHRHYQEVVDGFDRPLSLVTAPNPAHTAWLRAEARHLAHLSHPSIPTTYHYWVVDRTTGRGPGYLRRWISGETLGARIGREGPDDIAYALQVLRATGSALAYLHDAGIIYGALSPSVVWVTPSARVWLPRWQWALPRAEIPQGMAPDRRWLLSPPEWGDSAWEPTVMSDQWQLAATCFAALVGESTPSRDVPPLRWVRPEVPQDAAEVLDRALAERPRERFPSVAALLRAVDRAIGSRTVLVIGAGDAGTSTAQESVEQRLRWALADDYEVLASLGSGTFGSVWRVRDLSLEREVALKMLHPWVALDQEAVSRFRREARLAAQLAHPAIVPIYDWDSRGDVSWYTMELAEGGSLSGLIERSGPRSLDDAAPHIEAVLDALATAHGSGIIHRDLKPENILLDRYRRWRIADFGVARAVEENATGATGTPAFAAPEQLLNEPQGPAADCFAAAAIVAYVLTGAPPFGTGDAKAILARQLSGTLDLRAFPAEIVDWLRRGLAPNPPDRFADAAEMLAAFRLARRPAEDTEQPRWRRWLARRPDARRPADEAAP
jgi:serine/threonine protein kinase